MDEEELPAPTSAKSAPSKTMEPVLEDEMLPEDQVVSKSASAKASTTTLEKSANSTAAERSVSEMSDDDFLASIGVKL